MAGKSKKLKKLEDHHDYLNRKTKEIDIEREEGERSGDGKALLVRLKKQKLKLKDQISRIEANLLFLIYLSWRGKIRNVAYKNKYGYLSKQVKGNYQTNLTCASTSILSIV